MDSDFAAGEDTAFVNDEISNIIKESIGKFSGLWDPTKQSKQPIT